MHVYFVLVALFFTVRCRAVVDKMTTAPNEVDEDDRTTTPGLLYEGAYRPQIHFSPPKVSEPYLHSLACQKFIVQWSHVVEFHERPERTVLGRRGYLPSLLSV